MGKNPPDKSKTRRQNIVNYESLYPIYATSFSAASRSLIAVGSYIEGLNNRVDIASFSDETSSLTPIPALSFSHPYPPTKLLFHPSPNPPNPNLLASSGDYLRLWNVNESSTEAVSKLTRNKASEELYPITSFDWNVFEPRRIGTSSTDCMCTIWDIEKGAVETPFLAHDKEVHDIAWGEAAVFASVSADGSLRMVDMRDEDNSTIVYESPNDTPLLRLAWNKQDLRYMATTSMDSNKIVILDIRSATVPVMELERHQGSVNSIAWAPQSSRHICSGGDDEHALLWELPTVAGPKGIDPLMMYDVGEEVNSLQWSAAQPDWIAVAFGNKIQMLNV